MSGASKTYKVTSECFFFSFPHEKFRSKYVVYCPLRQLALLVNRDVVEMLYLLEKGDFSPVSDSQKNVLNFLVKFGLMNGQGDKLPAHDLEDFAPTRATLFLSSECNFQCQYCYADCGAGRGYMEIEMAKAAIDYIINNALKKGSEEVNISFHGGGEPTLNWKLFVETISYFRKAAKEKNLRNSVHLATNGYLSNSKADFIVKAVDHVSVSIDGPKDIQNSQRPLKTGKGTFDRVYRTIKRWDACDLKYGIRSTITGDSIRYMKDIVEFFARNFKVKDIQLDPVFSCNRCLSNKVKIPSSTEFIDNYRKASKIAEDLEIKLSYSGARFGKWTPSFCGVPRDNFMITTDGYITSCNEVVTIEDKRADIFIYGRFDSRQKKFIIDTSKLNFLRSLTVHNIPTCSDCFCKWHCAGDCPAKRAYVGDVLTDVNETRCLINQELTKDQIAKYFLRDDQFILPFSNSFRI